MLQVHSSDLLYEQPGGRDLAAYKLQPSRQHPKQRVTQSAMEAAIADAPLDEFDDDDFLSRPADIPVDPNSEAKLYYSAYHERCPSGGRLV